MKVCQSKVKCKYCSKRFLVTKIDEHEIKCNLPKRCRYCLKEYKRHELPKHEKHCSGNPAGSGSPDKGLDSKQYIDMIEKNKKKMKRRGTRVVVEDDFIESNDFRDPGNRKKKESVPAVRT